MKTESNIYFSQVAKQIKYFSLFSCLAISAPLLALVPYFVPADQVANLWFQRSGSAMVVFGLLAESRAVNIFLILNPSTWGEVGLSEALKKYGKYPTYFNIFAFVLIAFGTLIWGYGDLWV
jgi:hypothetical protein